MTSVRKTVYMTRDQVSEFRSRSKNLGVSQAAFSRFAFHHLFTLSDSELKRALDDYLDYERQRSFGSGYHNQKPRGTDTAPAGVV